MRLSVLFLAVLEAAFLIVIGNRLPPPGFGDAYGDADAIRSSQFYVEHGFGRNAGLPSILYGDRFPHDGWLGELRKSSGRSADATELKDGVYTRYPPLPNWLCAISEHVFGFSNLWAWRLLPIAIGLSAFSLFISWIAQALGRDRAAIISIAVAALPMTRGFMMSLHYEGYAQALLLIELALLIREYWGGNVLRTPYLVAMASLAFIQGYLSFDYVFVVCLAPVPLWLLRRADARNSTVDLKALIVPVMVVGAGFVLAHALHFAQVISFYGDWRLALGDFVDRARYRAAGKGTESFATLLARVFRRYASIVATPANDHFGPLFLVATACVGGSFIKRSIGRISTTPAQMRRFIPAICAGFGIATLWMLAMPSMSLGHTHIVPRLLFTAYFVMVLAMVLSVTRVSNSTSIEAEPVLSHDLPGVPS